MTILAAGTASALKLRAIAKAMERLGFIGTPLPTEVNSIVSSQPFGYEEMRQGAEYRAIYARKCHDADFGIGVESGLVQVGQEFYDVPCAAVVDRKGRPIIAYGACMPIPQWIVDKVTADHMELGHIIQAETGGGEKDPHKWLSSGEINRDEIVMQAILCAFAPLRNSEKYRRSRR